MRRLVPWLLVASVSCAGAEDATAADGGDPPAECSALEPLTEPLASDCSALDVPACGGDPVGHWTRLAACGYGGPIPTVTTYTGGECAGDSIRIAYDVTGSLDVLDDATIVQDAKIVQTIGWEIPEACLALLDIADCEALAAEYDVGDCVAVEGGGCACDLVAQTLIAHAVGVWATCDGSLTVADAQGTLVATYSGTFTTTETASSTEPSTSDYCVDGETLWLTDEARQAYAIYVRVTD